MLGIRRETKENGPQQPDNSILPLLERRISHLEQALKLMDVDLQDAINGFYRRRQADRMREIREEDAPKRKRTTDRDILMRALQLSDDGRKNESENSHGEERRD
jgi:hypothetical protein